MLGVLVLSTMGIALWMVARRDGGRASGPGPVAVGHGVKFELEVSRVSIRSIAEEPDRAGVEAETEDVRILVQDLYLGAFVDPHRWDDGTFPDAFESFDAGSAAKAYTELNALTLGDAATHLEWVDPTRGRTSIVFLLDQDNQPVTAVAGVVFRGIGHLQEGGTVAINNNTDLWLRPVDGEWQVYSYTASTVIGPKPAAESSPSGAGG
ncbi:MAG: hypothetical protein LC722_05140 [Actinobacteria bacterium]|nr:hypothetical protein [Actinomycetota bacterium]